MNIESEDKESAGVRVSIPGIDFACRITKDMVTVGIVTDTHIPDRVNRLHPGIVPALKNAGVDLILHAGDISIPAALEELGTIAPVYAVRGNRDWLLADRLKGEVRLEINGVVVAMVHGHGSLRDYLKQKVQHYISGYDIEQYITAIISSCAEANVTVYGHTHCSEIHWRDGRLFFNPGSASTVSPYSKVTSQSIGILKISADGQIQAEVVELPGWLLRNRQWVENLR